MILLIDNYDSFSWNLYQMLGEIEPDIVVVCNDRTSCQRIETDAPTHIVLSPGPGKPSDAGICEEVVRRFAGAIPLLGVCLGHQAICEVYGASVGRAPQPMHGKTSTVRLDRRCPLYAGMSAEIQAARYHSLAADGATIPDTLLVNAWTESGEVMGVQHRIFPVYGVQFHPESILTPEGATLLANFLALRHPKDAP